MNPHPRAPLRWLPLLALTFIFPLPHSLGDPSTPRPVSAKLEPERKRLVISVDDAVFTVYKFAPHQKLPYFWPLNGPRSGASVTTESSWPYPHHQSLFFGCDLVNGGNYWQEAIERGQIVSAGPQVLADRGDRVRFIDTCLWRQPGQDPILRDERQIVISAPNDQLRFLDFAITLTPLVEVRIRKSNHSLFSARVVPELSVEDGGTLVNADGQTGEAGTFGQPSPWCDYSGTRRGLTEGLAILQHPHNRWFPARWFTRNYGFFSPTPMFWLDPDPLVLPKDQPLTLRYRVIVHAGDAPTAKIQDCFDAYAREPLAPAPASP